MKIILFFIYLNLFIGVSNILASTASTDKSNNIANKATKESRHPFAKVLNVEGLASYLTPGTKDALPVTKDQIIYSDTSLEVKDYGEIKLKLISPNHLEKKINEIRIGASSIARLFRFNLNEYKIELLTGHLHFSWPNEFSKELKVIIETQEGVIAPQKSQTLVIYNPLIHQTNLFVKEGSASFYQKDYPTKLKVIQSGNYAILPRNTTKIEIQDKLSKKESERMTKEFKLKAQDLNPESSL
jgi:hypothetical protein